MNTVKICKKCSEPIYTKTYYTNAKTQDGCYYHERCLKSCGFVEQGDANTLVNRSKVYTAQRYTVYQRLKTATRVLEIIDRLQQKDHSQEVQQIWH